MHRHSSTVRETILGTVQLASAFGLFGEVKTQNSRIANECSGVKSGTQRSKSLAQIRTPPTVQVTSHNSQPTNQFMPEHRRRSTVSYWAPFYAGKCRRGSRNRGSRSELPLVVLVALQPTGTGPPRGRGVCRVLRRASCRVEELNARVLWLPLRL